ncbi:elastin [Penaeus vannamei]|uniref:elastin n=1 Tax=Penaeus vannamei TaxID=6689 RepID=UPI00387F64E3
MRNTAVVVVVLCVAAVVVCGLALPPPESGITGAFLPSAADIGSMALIKPPVPALPVGLGAIPGVAGGVIPGMPGGAIPGLAGGAIPGLAGGAIPGLAGGAIPGLPGGVLSGVPGGAKGAGSSVPVVGAMQIPVIGSLDAMSIPVAPPTIPPAVSSFVKKKISGATSLSPVPAKPSS